MAGNDSHYQNNRDSEEQSLLSIDGLAVRLAGESLVRRVELNVERGSIHCLVGDSGSGKTLTSLAAVGLLPSAMEVTGSIRLAGLSQDLVQLPRRSWDDVRGKRIGYVGQNALGCLHPAYTIEFQLAEAIKRHQNIAKSALSSLILEELRAVDVPNPEQVAASRPAQLSGGMCQRVALAIALCNRPSVLIADEPTTALDADTQANILELLTKRVASDGLGVLLITHDRDVVDEVADSVTTISHGVSTPVEPTPVVHTAPRNRPPAKAATERLALDVRGVSMTYGRSARARRSRTETLSDVNISAERGTTVGLVGRSGAGKTTLAQIISGILQPTAGEVLIDGVAMSKNLDRREKASLVQYVFQDPFGSLNPRRTVHAQVAEPLLALGRSKEEANEAASAILSEVGLSHAQVNRRPTELSGGQCQRAGIARALINRPGVVVLDEPVSALDWSIRAEILAILDHLQDATHATYLLIAHDRPLIEEQCDVVYEVRDGLVCHVPNFIKTPIH